MGKSLVELSTDEYLLMIRTKLATDTTWSRNRRRRLENSELLTVGRAVDDTCPDTYGHSHPAAREALRRAAGTRDLLRWNDRPWRRHKHVIRLFDKAIKAEEEEARRNKEYGGTII
jgi:hypothetical protein